MEKNLLSVLLVDPNGLSRTSLRRRLEAHPNISTIHEAASAEHALFKIIEQSPDIVFLGLKTQEEKDIELIRIIKKRALSCHLVIVSADRNFAIQAIRNQVYAFLLKPVTNRALNEVIDKYFCHTDSGVNEKVKYLIRQVEGNKRIWISSVYDHTFIDPDNIVYCEAQGSYTTVHLDNGTKELANTYLGVIAQKLPRDHFFRISRNFLINLNRLLRVDRNAGTCVLAAGKKRITLPGVKKQLRLLCE